MTTGLNGWETIGIRPKFDFDRGQKDTKPNDGVLVGVFVGSETAENPNAKKEKDRKFTVWYVADSDGREWSLAGGHLDYLFNKAVSEKKLTQGQGVRITGLGWDEMEGDMKCRKFNLECQKA